MKNELYWIYGTWPGRLAIMPRPRGGDWLEDEVRAWKSEGVEEVVSLLEESEVDELDLCREPMVCAKFGVGFQSFPIADRGLPESRVATVEIIRKLEADLAAGKRVALHCRAGVGRSAMLAACLLALAGSDVTTAFKTIKEARGCDVPDTGEQRNWVEQFVRSAAVGIPRL